MQIDRVSYSYLSNLGDYRNERISMEAKLDDGESPESAIAILKQRILEIAGEDSQKAEAYRYQLTRECRDLEKKLAQAREAWEATAEFLKAQGLRADPPAFPENLKLLPASSDVDADLDAMPF